MVAWLGSTGSSTVMVNRAVLDLVARSVTGGVDGGLGACGQNRSAARVLLRAGLCGIDDGDGAVWRRWELGFAWCRQRWVLELKRAAAVVVSWRFGVFSRRRNGQRRVADYRFGCFGRGFWVHGDEACC